jgi:hypothetical protein
MIAQTYLWALVIKGVHQVRLADVVGLRALNDEELEERGDPGAEGCLTPAELVAPLNNTGLHQVLNRRPDLQSKTIQHKGTRLGFLPHHHA